MTRFCAICNSYNRANNYINLFLLSSLKHFVNNQKLSINSFEINDSSIDDSGIENFRIINSQQITLG